MTDPAYYTAEAWLRRWGDYHRNGNKIHGLDGYHQQPFVSDPGVMTSTTSEMPVEVAWVDEGVHKLSIDIQESLKCRFICRWVDKKAARNLKISKRDHQTNVERGVWFIVGAMTH